MSTWMIKDAQGMTFLHLPEWEKRGVKAFYSTRKGGMSRGAYQTMNLALHVGDEPELVAENRSRLLALHGGSLRDLVCCQQVHEDRVAVVGKSDAGCGALDYDTSLPGYDALITDVPGIHLGAFFADCFSIFLFDPRRRVIGLAHAGWKGTMKRIAARTVREMQARFSSLPEDLEVFIGPGIGACCFEIQADLAHQVEQSFANPGDLIRESGGRCTWDLAASNASILAGTGVDPNHIEICGLCTSCRDDLFYSYRRDRGTTGRMGAFITLDY